MCLTIRWYIVHTGTNMNQKREKKAVESRQVHFRLPKDAHVKLERIAAAKRRRSVSDLIRAEALDLAEGAEAPR